MPVTTNCIDVNAPLEVRREDVDIDESSKAKSWGKTDSARRKERS